MHGVIFCEDVPFLEVDWLSSSLCFTVISITSHCVALVGHLYLKIKNNTLIIASLYYELLFMEMLDEYDTSIPKDQLNK